jgi:Prohead core protein serine protease
MKLIRENIETVNYISEAREDGKKNYFIEGIFIQTEKANRNGRLYEKKMMEPVIEKYINESVKNNRAFGELNHPASPAINLDRVCIMIKELNWADNDVRGKALVTETPMGNTLKGLLESGARLGVSTRGMGELEARSDGVLLVKPGFLLATAADVVADPSAPDAFVTGIMENVDWFYDPASGEWFTKRVEETKNQIKKMSLREIEEKKIAMFENFINSLSFGKNQN